LPVNVSIAGKEPVAVKGVLDLREYKPGDRIKVNLNGEWEFYWNRFLYPSDFTTSEKRPQPDIYGKVPAYWTSYSGEIPVNKYGYAAYRLVILLPENTETSYAFDIPVFDSSFELWVNDSLLYSNGKPGTTSETTIPEYRPGLRVYNSSSDTLSILINVANFHHRRGGFWQTMVFGTYKDVQKSVASKLAADYITVGILGSFATTAGVGSGKPWYSEPIKTSRNQWPANWLPIILQLAYLEALLCFLCYSSCSTPETKSS